LVRRPLLKFAAVNRPELTFPRFWEPYPRKEARKDALKAWCELDPNETLIADILAAVAWQAHLWVVIEHRQSKHIPLGATYLRGERWTDERRVVAKPKPVTDEELAHVHRIHEQKRAQAQLMAQDTADEYYRTHPWAKREPREP
jgi:hypothetical protein